MESIIDVARDKGLSEIDGLVLANNPDMLKLMRRLGFTVKLPEDPDFKLVTYMLCTPGLFTSRTLWHPQNWGCKSPSKR